MPNLYKRLRNLREDHDLTQKDVAEHLKCSRTAYEGYERGYRNIPVEHLMKLSELYSVSMEYIVEMTNDKKETPLSRRSLTIMVVQAGIEPATHGFSVHCSTN